MAKILKLRAGPASYTPSPKKQTRSFMGTTMSSMGPNLPL